MAKDKGLPVIRCSSLPRVLTCHASLDMNAMQIVHDSSDVARIGNAVHELLAKYITNVFIDFNKIIKKHRVSADDVSALHAVGKRIWGEYQSMLKVLSVEDTNIRNMGNGIALRGTADVITEILGEDCLFIIDWKTGVIKDAKEQLLGYGWLAKQHWTEAKAVKIMTVWLRDQEVIIHDLKMEEIDALPDRIADAMAKPNLFSPSHDRCQYCPRNATCPAKQAIVQSAVTDLAEIGSQTALTPRGLAALWGKYKMLKKAMESYHDTLNGALIAEGSIDMGDGKEMTLVDTQKEKIDTPKAFAAIREHYPELTTEDIVATMSMAKGKMTKVISAQAERGQKKIAIKEFLDQLREADAIKTTVSQKITVRDVQVQEKET